MTGTGRSGLDLSGRVALVTGGTRGIGEAIVQGLAGAGARVVTASRSAPAALAGRLADGQVATFPADVARKADVDGLVARVAETQGGLDVLVNCAGTARRVSALETTPADVDYMIDVNLKGVTWTCQAVAPLMRQRGGGRIVNITSVGASTGLVNRSAYCAAKAGVGQLTKCLALEWGPWGITVNAVGPGITVTPLTEPYLAANPQKERTMVAKIPLRRLGRPGDMVGAVLYLASDLAAYVTGQTIVVDGGLGVGDSDW